MREVLIMENRIITGDIRIKDVKDNSTVNVNIYNEQKKHPETSSNSEIENDKLILSSKKVGSLRKIEIKAAIEFVAALVTILSSVYSLIVGKSVLEILAMLGSNSVPYIPILLIFAGLAIGFLSLRNVRLYSNLKLQENYKNLYLDSATNVIYKVRLNKRCPLCHGRVETTETPNKYTHMICNRCKKFEVYLTKATLCAQTGNNNIKSCSNSKPQHND